MRSADDARPAGIDCSVVRFAALRAAASRLATDRDAAPGVGQHAAVDQVLDVFTNQTVKNGFEMLLIQAEENWRIWNSD